MKPTIYTSPLSLSHDTGEGHPESPARIIALNELFASAPFSDWPQKQGTPVDLETILLAHDEDYIFNLQDNTPDQGLFYLDGDTVLSPASYDAALHAAGTVCNAVDDILDHNNGNLNSDTSTDLPSRLRAWRQTKKPPSACGHEGSTLENANSVFVKRAFCATRPPGHHAEPNTALGFCLMNNVFIGAKYAQEKYGLNRIAIIDFDVHHGNGTETMTHHHNKAHPDKPISYISSHSYPLFPMTGDPADNSETLLNIRLPDACASENFRKLYEEQVFSHLNASKPEIIFTSAGFDAHINDPLANINLNTEDFAWITRKICDISAKHSQNRVISVLEGGYHVPTLIECVTTHLEELAR